MPKKIYTLVATVALATSIFSGGFIQEAKAAPCTGLVILYDELDYGGACRDFTAGTYHLNTFDGGSWDNRAQSIKVTNGFRVLLEDDHINNPQSRYFTSNSPTLYAPLNKKASYMTVNDNRPPEDRSCAEGQTGTYPDCETPPVELENPIGTESFDELVAKLSLWFYIFSIPILSLLILYGGFLILISAGEEEKYSKGIKVIKWGVIGFILIGLSGAIAAIIRWVVS